MQNIIYKIYKRKTMKRAAVRQTPNTFTFDPLNSNLKYMSNVKSMNFSLISDTERTYSVTPTDTGSPP